MLLVCPSCATCFRVPAGAIAGEGRQVRCAACRTVWHAAPAELVEEAAAEHAPASAPQTEPRPPSRLAAVAESAAATAAGLPDDLADGPSLPPPPEPAARLAIPAADLPDIEAPPLVPAEDGPDDAAIATPEHPDIETVAHRPLSPRRRPAQPSGLTLGLRITVALMAAALMGLFAARDSLVRLNPGLAGLYAALGMPVNLRGLELHEVRSVRDVKDGVPVLLIDGYVFNPGPKVADVPKLRLAVLASTGRELYAWTAAPTAPMLSAGEGFRFSSRLASPPQEAREVLVRFLHRRDLAYDSR